MAAFFTASSTQYLSNTSPAITNYPFTVGLWLKLTAVGTVSRTLWSVSDSATTNNWLGIEMTSGEILRAAAAAGGSTVGAALSTAIVADAWVFVVGRFASSTSRLISAYYSNTGLTESANNVTTRAPSGMDRQSIGSLVTSAGATQLWDGSIAEYWLADSDIKSNANSLSTFEIRQLALGGPFSLPEYSGKIIEYRSLRCYPASDGDSIQEVFYDGIDRQTWTNTNGVTIGAHPPLPYWYVNPTQYIRELVV